MRTANVSWPILVVGNLLKATIAYASLQQSYVLIFQRTNKFLYTNLLVRLADITLGRSNRTCFNKLRDN